MLKNKKALDKHIGRFFILPRMITWFLYQQSTFKSYELE